MSPERVDVSDIYRTKYKYTLKWSGSKQYNGRTKSPVFWAVSRTSLSWTRKSFLNRQMVDLILDMIIPLKYHKT